MKTYSAKPTDINQEWFVADVDGKTLGRVATKIATILQGKHKAMYTPSMDTGDFVIVLNASKIKLTGKKEEQKIYYSHSGYIGGLKEVSFRRMLEKRPERIIELAVKGMLPKGRLGRQMIKKMKVYAGSEHPHEAQTPKPLDV